MPIDITGLLYNFCHSNNLFIHNKRYNTLILAVQGLISDKNLPLTSIGRAINSHSTDKHSIKKIDRLLSNDKLIN